jgi:GT2 family glycosyltransferase
MNVSDCTHPEMSIVIVTPDRYETIRRTILHLRSQKARDLLEVVIVAPSKDELGLIESEVKDFLQCCIVEVGPIHSTAKARAAGIRQASAPVIALVEDHSYPCPGWAETLIAAHRQPWAAVGPVVCNANPGSLTSWTNLLLEYGPWLDPREAKSVDHLPGHNATYKRSHLLAYGPELEAMLEAESILHWDLRAKGYELYLEPEAKTSHLNFSSILSSIPLRFYAGRLFASTRARHWSLFRRFFYFTSSPLIPLVRLLRIIRELRRPGRPRNLLPSILPALVIGLILDGAGEMIGYVFGGGNAMVKLSDMEFHRYRYLNKQDKRTFTEQ